MQALVAIQLVNNQALQFLPVQLPILTIEVFFSSRISISRMVAMTC